MPAAASAPPAAALHRLEPIAAPRYAEEAAQTPGFGLEVRQRPDVPSGAAASLKGGEGKGTGARGLLSRAEVAGRFPAGTGAGATGLPNPGTNPKVGGARSAEAQLAADLALLQRTAQSGGDAGRGKAGGPEAGGAGDGGASWRPPEGQKGDGRTSLNDLLGY